MWPFYKNRSAGRIRSDLTEYFAAQVDEERNRYNGLAQTIVKRDLPLGKFESALAFISKSKQLRESYGQVPQTTATLKAQFEELFSQLQAHGPVTEEDLQALKENPAFKILQENLYSKSAPIIRPSTAAPMPYNPIKTLRKLLPLFSSSIITLLMTGEIKIDEISQSFAGDSGLEKLLLFGILLIGGTGGNALKFLRDRQIEKEYTSSAQ